VRVYTKIQSDADAVWTCINIFCCAWLEYRVCHGIPGISCRFAAAIQRSAEKFERSRQAQKHSEARVQVPQAPIHAGSTQHPNSSPVPLAIYKKGTAKIESKPKVDGIRRPIRPHDTHRRARDRMPVIQKQTSPAPPRPAHGGGQ
jgi:hypothetical protein